MSVPGDVPGALRIENAKVELGGAYASGRNHRLEADGGRPPGRPASFGRTRELRPECLDDRNLLIRKEFSKMQTYIRVQNMIASLRDAERGATAVEYGLIVALIAAVIVALVAAVGQGVEGGFDTVNTELTNASAN